MSQVQEQFRDVPCLNCGGTYRPAPQPSDEQRHAAANRDNPTPLPPHYDTAPKSVVDELGALWVCDRCGSGMRGLKAKFDAAGKHEDREPAKS